MILMFVAGPLFAQQNQNEYLQGKQFLKEQRYALAMESFKPLIGADSNNPLTVYAMFYYAVAAYKDGFPPQAKTMFLQIQERYPRWDQIEEVHLWLANIYFEENKFNQAMNSLSKIRDRGLQDQKDDLLKNFLAKTDDIFLLEEWYNNHSDNRVLASRLATVIAEQPLQQRDNELLTDLIKKFNFDQEQFDAAIITKTVFKDKYRVAVLLPFVHESIDVSVRKKKNQFVLDIYNGIRMAADKLADRGIEIEIFAYDTRREYNATAEILEKDEMKTMDLIIGPLYPEPLQLVQEFAYRNKINMINPLSNNPDIIANNPFSFLYNPSQATMGKAIAEYAKSVVSNPYGIILYGESREDSILAQSYKETYETDSFRIVLMEKISSNNVRRVLDILTVTGGKLKDAVAEEDEEEVVLTIPKDSIGSVFVASDDGLIITRALSGIETRDDGTLIFGSEEWLEITAIDYTALERLKVSMAAPTYIDMNKDSYKTFRNEFITRHKELPNSFNIVGYDLMLMAGTLLKKYGKYFQVEIQDAPPLEGELFTGYNFSNGNDNQVVPIVRVINNEPQIVITTNYGDNQE